MKATSGKTWSFVLAIVAMSLAPAGLSRCCSAVQNRVGGSQQGKQMDEVPKLPMNPETVVFQLAFTGGYRMRTPEGFQPSPRLRIYADGRVVTGQNRPDQEVFEMRLADGKLLEFLKQVVNEFDLFSIDSGEIREAIQATGRPISIIDVPSTEVVVRLADKEHSISVFASGFCASAYPEIEALQRLVKIEKLAQRFVTIAQLGGPEILDSIIEFGNTEMARGKHSELKLDLENLDSSRRIDKNKFEARFVIKFREAQKKLDSLLTVIVEYDVKAGSGKLTTYLSSAHE